VIEQAYRFDSSFAFELLNASSSFISAENYGRWKKKLSTAVSC
jgi:hypothetical protein